MVITWQCPAFGADEKRGTSGGECYGSYNSSAGVGTGTGYTNACIHSGSNSYSGGDTVWYNYPAATAETITGVSNTIVATESVCPKGWSLPTKIQSGSNTNITNFLPVLGGSYNNGSPRSEATGGAWWGSEGSETYNNVSRYLLLYDSSTLSIDYGRRYNGYYIRCVSEEKDVSDLTYMQDMTAKVADGPKGWTLPSKIQIDSLSGGGVESGSSAYVSSFSPILGGSYSNGALYNETKRGVYWGAESDNEPTSGKVGRYYLLHESNTLFSATAGYRRSGNYIRCIQAS